MSYTDAEQHALSTVSVITSTVSLISCLCVVACWVMFKDLRTLAYAFVFYMAIATIIRTQAKMWGGHYEEGDLMCTIQGFLMIYGGLSTFYWMMTVAIVMHTLIFFPVKWRKATSNCKRLSLSINFTVPFLFALLPVLTNDYAPTGGWCWISNTTTVGKIFRWICFYGQLMVILGFCIYAYCRIYYFLRFSRKASELTNTHKMYNRIKFYPLCLIAGYSVAMVRRFIELWDVHLGFGVAMATSVTTGLFGFFLLMVYGRLGKVSKLMKKRYPCCIPICNVRDKICCRGMDEPDSEESSRTKSTTTPKPVPPAIQMVEMTTHKGPAPGPVHGPSVGSGTVAGTQTRTTDVSMPPELDMMDSAGTLSCTVDSLTARNMTFAIQPMSEGSPIQALAEIADPPTITPVFDTDTENTTQSEIKEAEL